MKDAGAAQPRIGIRPCLLRNDITSNSRRRERRGRSSRSRRGGTTKQRKGLPMHCRALL